MSFFARRAPARAENPVSPSFFETAPPHQVPLRMTRTSCPALSQASRLKWTPYVELLRLDGRVEPGHDARYLWGDFFKNWYYSGAAWLSIRGGGGDSVLAIPAFTAD